jgi:seryl-tRNA synthetase
MSAFDFFWNTCYSIANGDNPLAPFFKGEIFKRESFMLDIKFIADNLESAKSKLKDRLKGLDSLDKAAAFYQEKREIQKTADALRSQKKNFAKEIGMLKTKGADASSFMKDAEKLNTELEKIEERERILSLELEGILLTLPNIPLEDVPAGANESFNKEIKKWGESESFTFQVLPHYEIAEKLGILDFERGVKIAQSGFTLYHGTGAKLERALINFMLDTHGENGYQEKFVPFLVRGESLQGTGQLPKFKEDLYKIEGENLYLNPTAEVPLTNIYQNEILNEKDLPLYFTAYAPSFRKEAGSYGKDTRGIIRQHQFNKVELVEFSKPEDSEKEHQSMLAEAEKILQLLKLPYRIVILSTGDMGFSAAKCYDIEVWIPSMKTYKEISSVSNCMDFQARRANIKFRRESTGKVEYLHTLNGSGLAVGRTMVAILENYQREDGSVVIPDVLRKYMGNCTCL